METAWEPRVPRTATIVISCYNYGQFLAGAIESALQQSCEVEVIVVDDGSTDDSREVMGRYGDRIRSVHQSNGGQASAINVGCRLAQGEAIFLLDADDELQPEAVATVLAAWQPEAVLVQWRPSLMNAEGRDIPGAVPAPWIPLDQGDVREQMLTTGGYVVTVTSGLAFRRETLLRVLPMPEERFRQGADGFLVRATAFLGSVQALEQPLTRYRLHGSNLIGGSAPRIAATCRKYILWAVNEFDAVRSLARQHGLEAAVDLGEQNPDFLRFRLYSLVADPKMHPIHGDTRARLLPRLIAAQWRAPVGVLRQLLMVAVDSMVALLPPLVGWRFLSWWYSFKETRRRPRADESRPGWLARFLVSESIREMTAGPDTAAGALSRETRIALRNAMTLTVSLVGTWSVGLVVRFWLPRHLGPERFGLLSFAEGLAATTLACTGLGIDTYIQKEIPIRPQAASEFYGGTVILRALLSAILIVGLVFVPLGVRQLEGRHLLLVYGIGYLVFALNGSLAALLQANATVDELARTNVATKVLWGIGMGAGILLGLPLITFAVVFMASELFKVMILQRVARLRLGLRFIANPKATSTVVLASLGFYAAYVAQVLGLRLDVAMLGFLTTDRDVGWYGASQTLAGITLLLTPVLAAVLMPLFSRAYGRSTEDMFSVLRRALEGIVCVTTPVALLLAFGAEIWIGFAFGAAFAPAAGTLRTLGPLFVIIYVSILLAAALIVQGRGWRLTTIALAGITIHFVAALLLVPTFEDWLGPGGAGTGMAVAALSKEIIVMSFMLLSLGPGVIDRRSWSMIARTILTVLATTAVHLALQPLGPWRLVVDCAVYPALAIGLGAVDPRAIVTIGRELMPERSRSI